MLDAYVYASATMLLFLLLLISSMLPSAVDAAPADAAERCFRYDDTLCASMPAVAALLMICYAFPFYSMAFMR